MTADECLLHPWIKVREIYYGLCGDKSWYLLHIFMFVLKLVLAILYHCNWD